MDVLEQATQDYWNTSLVFHRGVGSTISTGDAISLLAVRFTNLGPHRKVKWRLIQLQDKIISGKVYRKKKEPPPQNVLQFRSASQ